MFFLPKEREGKEGTGVVAATSLRGGIASAVGSTNGRPELCAVAALHALAARLDVICNRVPV